MSNTNNVMNEGLPSNVICSDPYGCTFEEIVELLGEKSGRAFFRTLYKEKPKIQNQTIRTNAVHKCCAFGYYDISSGYAVISTSHVQVRFNDSNNNWLCLFGFIINGINFKCLSNNYGYLYGDDNTWFSNNSNFAYSNNPLLPPVVGKFECAYFTGKRYRSSPDTDDFYHNALFPYGVQGYYNNKSYHLYIVRAENCDDRGTGVDRLVIKITDCLMIKSSDGF